MASLRHYFKLLMSFDLFCLIKQHENQLKFTCCSVNKWTLQNNAGRKQPISPNSDNLKVMYTAKRGSRTLSKVLATWKSEQFKSSSDDWREYSCLAINNKISFSKQKIKGVVHDILPPGPFWRKSSERWLMFMLFCAAQHYGRVS